MSICLLMGEPARNWRGEAMAQEKGAGGVDQGGRIWKAWEVQHHGLLMDCWGTGGGRKEDGVWVQWPRLALVPTGCVWA